MHYTIVSSIWHLIKLIDVLLEIKLIDVLHLLQENE